MATTAPGERVARQFIDYQPTVERHFSYLGVRVPGPWVGAAFTFAMVACCLASSASGMRMGIVGFFALTGLLTLLYPHYVLKANARNAVLWLCPVWMALSTAWSIDVDRTFHSAQLLLPTFVAALTIGSLPDRRAMQAGAAVALLGYICLSFVYGHSTQIDTGDAFAGMVNGKNYFGHLAAMGFVMSLAFLAFISVPKGRTIVGVAFIGWFICGLALIESRATGSLIATGAAMVVFVVLLIYRRLGWALKAMVIVTVGGALILYATFGDEIQDYIFDFVLQKFNKDRTLTGRTALWDFADRLIDQRYFLGHGFNAFWYVTNPDAWTLWRINSVQPMSGFNFHNLPREVMIDGGMIGFGLLAGSVGYCFVRTTIRAIASGDAVSATRIAFLIYFAMRIGVETTGFAAVTVDTLLIFAFLCTTVDRKAAQEGPLRVARPRQVEVDAF